MPEENPEERRSLVERLSSAFLKPVAPAPTAERTPERPAEGIDVRRADDSERLAGLILAPFAALISILVITALIDHDPPAELKGGGSNRLHVSVSVYHELMIVMLVLSVAMLAMAWLRRRLYLGILLAMFGLAVFNLHYWGFGIPYLLAGAWLLVRSYRLSQELKTGRGGGRGGGRALRVGAPGQPPLHTTAVPSAGLRKHQSGPQGGQTEEEDQGAR